ncbi:MAG: tRNA (adenosine(37)-N6)-threonylcarbamoyltransferase complex ATPase subunit type 1 TsaE [Phycisphaerales bacterium]|nr:tRNA (adenosine(37)-N6)-threonylcarbamoyltransferase complex ATPase subunit type 1 TsaE [Phycisphaerales bacterium]
MRQLITLNETETLSAGVELAGLLQGGDVLAMNGPLGAGKTCLVRGIAQGLGIASRDVSSPTFSILHEHAVGDQGRELKRMYHIDAYRLSGLEDLESVGWDECLGDVNGVLLIEWASKIEAALPVHSVHIDMSYMPEAGRCLQMHVEDVAGGRFAELWGTVAP